MVHLLLLIIYLTFISLGLPDSLLGSAWPIMQQDMNVPLSYAGIISMIISGGTIFSSLMSDKLTRKFKSGALTAMSVALTAVALFGFSISDSFIMLCFFAIPYGLGAGAVDATVNNYAALHYSARHMSWLHACWGVGASIGPAIMGYCLTNNFGWNSGYLSIAIIQIVLTFIIFMSIPLWKNRANEQGEIEGEALSLKEVVKIKGVKFVLVTFFGYCALEATAGLWATSYLVEHHGVSASVAANCAALFYIGITVGRFLSGFIAGVLEDKLLIRYGLMIILGGSLLIPMNGSVALVGLVVVGLGCAPIYPAVIHSTPYNFGKNYSGAIIGVQMATAYVGATVMPPLFGLIADNINIGLYPLYLVGLCILMIVMSELLNRYIKNRDM